jgi:signal transduction histidine kinase
MLAHDTSAEPREPSRRLGEYAFAAALVGLVFLVRLAAGAVVGSAVPFVAFIVPPLLASSRGGLGPGLFAAVVGTLLGNAFLPPTTPFTARVTATTGVLVVAVLVAWLGHTLRRARRTAQASAREARQLATRLTSVLESTTDGVLALDRDWRITYLNRRAAARVAGGRDLVGQTFWASFPDSVGTPFDHEYRRAMRDRVPVEFEAFYGPLAGWFDVHAYPADGGLVVFFREVTERRRAEEAQQFLVEAGIRLAGSLDLDTTLRGLSKLVVPRLADSYAVDLVAPDGTLERVAVAHVDPAKAELAREIARRHPRRADDPWHPSGAVIRTGRPLLLADAEPSLREGAERAAPYIETLRAIGFRSYMAVPLVARDRVIGTLSLGRYETADRFGEKDLSLAEDLARRAALAVDNARLFRDAQAAMREAEAAARARDAFLARASHELRTPLTSAVATVRLLKRVMAGALRERPEELVAIADRNLTSMLALVNDLLDASKLASGVERPKLAAIDLAATASRSVEVVAAQAREKGVAVVTRVPDGLRVLADQPRLEQVLVNLLGNGVKFTPPGGRVSLSAEGRADRVFVRVEDTGDGITATNLEKIFEPFFQANSKAVGLSQTERRAPRVRGTGLGLAICRQIVTLLGGRIWAESEGPGRGAAFVVELPPASTSLRTRSTGAA